jgi:tripartite-type tricarboxylate transporter receptor subunit TctC
MNLPRRKFLRLALGAAALPALPRTTLSSTYPVRPVHIIVGFAPGGSADILIRLIGQWLSERFGQPFVVENRPGAGGNTATEAVVRARPDGYTLLAIGIVNAWNAALYENLNFDLIRDITPVATLNRGLGVVVVHPSFPARTIPELIAYAKAHPGEVNMASGGIGSPQHVWGELFKMMAKVDMLHVPYRGGAPAIIDLLAGRVPLMFDTLSTSIENVRAGRLRALAVTATSRSELLPDIPTVGEFVPGYEATGWQGSACPTTRLPT